MRLLPDRGSGRSLLLVGSIPPPSGGIAAHLSDLARFVAAAGAAVRVAEVPTGIAHPATGARLLAALCAGRARGALLHLHTNGHNPGSWSLARLVALVAGDGEAVLTLHSGLAPAYVAAHRASCRSVAARYRRVICVSRRIAAALADGHDDACIIDEKIRIAPAFVAGALPSALPPPGLGAIRRRHPVLLAAALAQGVEYGAWSLIEGFLLLLRRIPEAGLVVFGPAARSPDLEALIATRGGEPLRARLHRYGDLPREEALGVMAAADVFVRPTLADGDAVSVREALTLGRRVVASDAAERVDGTRLFRAGDPEALAAAVVEALAAPPAPLPPTDGCDTVVDVYREAGLFVGEARAADADANADADEDDEEQPRGWLELPVEVR